MVKQSDYSRPEVDACFSVLMEVITILGKFRDNIVLVGGNVPPLLIPSAKEKHPGTLDIDLALDNRHISDDSYQTIVQALKSRGYYQKDGEQPFIFHRDFTTESRRRITVQIDFLSGEYGGTGKHHRHQRVQDALARKTRGCDLVFENSIIVKLSGTLPNGAVSEVAVNIPSAGAFLVTKGMALWDRLKEKDAFDIYFCCRYYSGGLKALAETIMSMIDNKLVKEGLGKIRAKFMEINSIGPVAVADFNEIEEPEERARIQREAFELVNDLMRRLRVEPFFDV
jgi:hypothetical protein